MIITSQNYKNYSIGSKAERLFQMMSNGMNVPDLFCVLPETSDTEILDYVQREFSDESLFSVRSSASSEDSSSFSFAGQLDTYLFVSAEHLIEKIKLCRASAYNACVEEYLHINGIQRDEFKVNVIVQRMINSECSGVIFTANPQGILNETVITVGSGTGDNVVEDRVNVNTYYCNSTDSIFYAELHDNAPELGNDKITTLLEIASDVRDQFKCECDIEFAIMNDEIFILQARPITTLHSDGHIILDSSNISESYPGISSPMTISFVKDVYHLIFSSCVRRITCNDGTAERLDGVLSNMTDSANGRIYYRISSWYDVITMLPFSKRIIPIWQEMLGVSDKSVTQSAKSPGCMTKIRVLKSFFKLLSKNTTNMKKLNMKFDNIYPEFSKRISLTDSSDELFSIYTDLKNELVDCWDLTLVNDMYAFIFTGLLKKSLKCDNPEDTANKLICGSDAIESMKPVKLLFSIREALINENKFEQFCTISSLDEFDSFISKQSNSSRLIEQYIEEFGDRCSCELKLEEDTYRTNPLLLVETISSLSESGFESSSERPKLYGISRLYAKKAYNGIMLREKSRMSRGKIFGLIREIVLKCGNDFCRRGLIDNQRDVFYLTFKELEVASNGETSGLQDLISSRKEKWQGFDEIPQYTRIIFDREVFDKHPANYVSASIEKDSTMIYGTPCSSGIVEGEVTHISELTADTDASGKIILADVTDPGWVFVISQALGIISKRGSLLSHTAIISRELRKPAVVGVGNACDHIHDGDYVRLNGIDGSIQLIRPVMT